MIALVTALLLAQTPPSDSELNGAYNAAQIAAAAAVAGTRVIAPVSAARSCIRFAGGGMAPPGAVTVSFGVSTMSAEFQQVVGMSLPPAVPDWAAVWDEYSYIEVQAVPAATRDPQTTPIYMDLMPEERWLEAGPSMPICEVLLVRNDHAGVPFRCACSTGAACNLTPASGGGAAPLHRTLGPGTWVGGGCQVKPCAARYEGGRDYSWPSACP